MGRTGAGKTTLAHSLLRFVQVTTGQISIDGVDIANIRLGRLRAGGIAIIPQDPFLFSGTLRSNLDVRGEKTDAELRAALWRVRVFSIILLPQVLVPTLGTLACPSTPAA